MKKLVFISKLLVYLLGGFFILMASDCFTGTESVWSNILCYLISCLPGIIIIGLTIILSKKELIMGIILLFSAVFFFIFFKFYIDIEDKILTIIIVMFPLLFAGTIFVLARNKYEK